MPRKPAKKSKRISSKRKKGFSWKLLAKNKKTKKKINRIISVFFLLLISSAFLSFLSIKKVLDKTFVSADSSTSTDVLDENRVSFAIVTVDDLDKENIKIISMNVMFFDRDNKKVVTFEVPSNFSSDVPGRFGVEEYSKLVTLGMIDSGNIADGSQFVSNTLKVKFAHRIDRYLIVEEGVSLPILEAFKNGKSSGLLSSEILSGLLLNSHTNLRVNEFYDLYTFVNGLPFDRFITHTLTLDQLSTNEYLDAVLRDLTFDSKVSLEQSSVAVLNGTNISGVATFGSRVLENIGAHVISVDNTRDTYHESVLVVSDVDLAVVKEIQRFFNIKKVLTRSEFTGNEIVADRADVTLIMGFDIANSL